MKEFLERINNLPPERVKLLAAQLQARVEALENQRSEPIAIIGMSCRFPGGADGPEAFWELLRNGVDAISEVPSERWKIDDYYDPDPEKPGKMSTRWGGFLRDVDRFDANFFGIAPREATGLDPQQRLLLELSWEALERAGQSPDRLMDSQSGVFIGISGSDYLHLQMDNGVENLDAYFASGNAHSIATGRLSYILGLRGPSFPVDTACSSSLVATHLAVQSLRNGECRLALAGGVNLILTPEVTVALSKAHMLSPDGRCKTFDARADGFVRGEGGGILILKRLSDALADGDNILALIRGSAINQDGRSNGLTAPNGPSQEAVIRAALSNGGIPPQQVSYVETHGTGTSLGDPIEVQALSAVLGEARQQPLMIGSVKTNFGHLESAAGIAGLMKIVLMLQHGQVPPHLHLQTPNPYIPWAELPVTVPTKLTSWHSEREKFAGLSSFGFSGTNAHLVLSSPPPVLEKKSEVERPLQLFTLSARNEAALQQLAKRYADHLADQSLNIADLAHTVNAGRSHFNYRLALTANTSEAIQRGLSAFVNGEESDRLIRGKVQGTQRPRIAFLFTGQGAQYQGMARQLYDTQPTFRLTLDKCDQLLRPYLERPLLAVLFAENESDAALINETAYTQPALFAVEYALAELWQSWGVQPAMVMGHSVGEYVAACLAGVFTLEEGLKLIAERARLMQRLPAGGAMAAVFSDEATVSKAIASFTDQLSIAAINGPSNVVISGADQALSMVLESLAQQGIKSRRLTVSHAFHSPLMESIMDEFENVAATVKYSEPRIGLMSNVTGSLATPNQVTDPRYWRDHIRQPVRFADAVVNLHQAGCATFVEIGPNPTLIGMGQQCLSEGTGTWLPSLRQGKEDWQTLLNSLAKLYTMGVEVDWKGFDHDYARQKLVLPTYPFQRERYWIRTNPNRRSYQATSTQNENVGTDELASKQTSADAVIKPGADLVHDLLYRIEWMPQESTDQAKTMPKSRWLIFADAEGVGTELARSLRLLQHECWLVTPDETYAELESNQIHIDPTQPTDFVRLLQRQNYDGIVYMWSLDNKLTEATPSESLMDVQKRITGGFLYLVQALVNKGASPLPGLWVVTQDAQAVGDDEFLQEAGQTAILGLKRTIALDYPELQCVCIDLPPQPVMDGVDRLRFEILQNDRHEDEVAIRDLRYVRRLVKASLAETPPPIFRHDTSYLITGGLRGLGLLVAEWMSTHGARHLILMSRNHPSEEAQAALDRMKLSGVDVLVATGDISVWDDAVRVLDQIQRIMPPLRGVIHMAGILDDGVLLQQSWSRFAKVMAPKVLGAWNLHLLTRDLSLDFLVMFSSGAALLGSAGQSNYATANAFMDGLAAFRHSQGLPAISINWGAWAEVGMAANRHLDRARGVAMLNPQVALEALGVALQSHIAQLAVLPVNWNQFLPSYPAGEEPAVLKEIARTIRSQSAPKETAETSLAQQLAETVPNKRKALLLAHVRQKAAQVLATDNLSGMDADEPLQTMGLDSLMAVELRNKLGQSAGKTLPATLLFECPTINALVDYLASEMSIMDKNIHTADMAMQKKQAPVASALDTTSLDALSEDELAAMLKSKLGEINSE
ncbi:MAG TPA: type I polyketide synthase [Anaerolineales bacterium]|nr:type I polyketide synthase [Anaerolineales bacterium]